jgi:hypothetical protein
LRSRFLSVYRWLCLNMFEHCRFTVPRFASCRPHISPHLGR